MGSVSVYLLKGDVTRFLILLSSCRHSPAIPTDIETHDLKCSHLIARVSGTTLCRNLQRRLASIASSWALSKHKISLVSFCVEEPSNFPPEINTLKWEFWLGSKQIREMKNAVGMQNADDLNDDSVMQDAASSNVPDADVAMDVATGLENVNEDVTPVASLASIQPGSVCIDEPVATFQDDRASVALARFVENYHVPPHLQFDLMARITLQQCIPSLAARRQCLRIRFLSLSVLLLSPPEHGVFEQLLQSDRTMIPDIVELLGSTSPDVPDVLRISGFRTLQAFAQAHIRVQAIVEALEVGVRHGLLPVLLRRYTDYLLLPALPEHTPLELVTSIFTLVQLLCNYQSGLDALLSSGTIATLMPLIANDVVHTKFSTRSARILESILHMSRPSIPLFLEVGAVDAFARRLADDIALCTPHSRSSCIGVYNSDRVAVKGVVDTLVTSATDSTGTETMEDSPPPPYTSVSSASVPAPAAATTTGVGTEDRGAATTVATLAVEGDTDPATMCPSDTKSRLKTLLKFLLQVVLEPAFATCMRNVVEGTLLQSLENLIRNPYYYGTTLWGSATSWVTVFSNNEPSLLSVLEDAGIHRAILEVLDVQIPASSDVLQDLPNLFSAMCLNESGLQLFLQHSPLKCLVRVFTLEAYLPYLSNAIVSTLGGALDELLRHQPKLRDAALDAVMELLTTLVAIGRDPTVSVITGSDHQLRRYERMLKTTTAMVEASIEEGLRTSTAGDSGTPSFGGTAISGVTTGESTVDMDITGDVGEVAGIASDGAVVSHTGATTIVTDGSTATSSTAAANEVGATQKSTKLYDYINNAMVLLEALFTTSGNQDNCNEFVTLGGVTLLLDLYQSPQLPLRFRHSSAAAALNSAVRAIASMALKDVLKQAAQRLSAVLEQDDIKHMADRFEEHGMDESSLRSLLVATTYVDLVAMVTQRSQASGDSGHLIEFWGERTGKECIDRVAALAHTVLRSRTRAGRAPPPVVIASADGGVAAAAAAAAATATGESTDGTESTADAARMVPSSSAPPLEVREARFRAPPRRGSRLSRGGRGFSDAEGVAGPGDRVMAEVLATAVVPSMPTVVLDRSGAPSTGEGRDVTDFTKFADATTTEGVHDRHLKAAFGGVVVDEALAVAETSTEALLAHVLRIAAGRSHRPRVFSLGGSSSTTGKSLTDNVMRSVVDQATWALSKARQDSAKKQPTATEMTLKDIDRHRRRLVANLARIQSIFRQFNIYVSESPPRGRMSERKAPKLLALAVHNFEAVGGTAFVFEAMAWMTEVLPEIVHGRKTPRVPTSTEMIANLGTLWRVDAPPNTGCRCALELADASTVHSHGGGAWVCDACQGKSEGRYTYHCKKCDYDICPRCFAHLAQTEDEKILFDALRMALVFVTRLLDPAMLHDQKNQSSSSPLKPSEFLSRVQDKTIPAISKLWNKAVINLCDHRTIQCVMNLISHMVTLEKDLEDYASADSARRRVPTRDFFHDSFASRRSTDRSAMDESADDASPWHRLIGELGSDTHDALEAHDADLRAMRSMMQAMHESDMDPMTAPPQVAPTPPAPPPPVEINPASAQMLQDMGFTANQARRALEMTNNNLEAAAELILTGGVPDRPPTPTQTAPPPATDATAADAPVATSSILEPDAPTIEAADPTDAADSATGTGASPEADSSSDASDDSNANENHAAAEDDDEGAEDSDGSLLARALAMSLSSGDTPPDGNTSAVVLSVDPAGLTELPSGSGSIHNLVQALHSTQLTTQGAAGEHNADAGAAHTPAVTVDVPLVSITPADVCVGSIDPSAPDLLRGADDHGLDELIHNARGSLQRSHLASQSRNLRQAMERGERRGHMMAREERRALRDDMRQRLLMGRVSSEQTRCDRTLDHLDVDMFGVGDASHSSASTTPDVPPRDKTAFFELRNSILDMCKTVIEHDYQQVFNAKTLVLQQLKHQATGDAKDASERPSKDALVKSLVTDVLVALDRVSALPDTSVVHNTSEALLLYVRLHFLLLIMVDETAAVTDAIHGSKLVPQLLALLQRYAGLAVEEHVYAPPSDTTTEAAPTMHSVVSPLWTAPVLLLLDHNQRVCLERAEEVTLRKACVAQGTGKWEYCRTNSGYSLSGSETFEPYGSDVSKALEERFAAFAPRATVTHRGQSVIVDFQTMLETHANPQHKNNNHKVLVRRLLPDMSSQGIASSASSSTVVAPTLPPPLSRADELRVAKICAVLVRKRIDQENLEATMRLVVRVTQSVAVALHFAREGGLAALLDVRQSSGFRITGLLTALIMRHTIEDVKTLSGVVRRVMRARLGARSILSGYVVAMVPVIARLRAAGGAISFESEAPAVVRIADNSGHDENINAISIVPQALERGNADEHTSEGLKTMLKLLVL